MRPSCVISRPKSFTRATRARVITRRPVIIFLAVFFSSRESQFSSPANATSIEDTSCEARVVAARGDCGSRRRKKRKGKRRRRRRRCRRCVARRLRLATINRGGCRKVSAGACVRARPPLSSRLRRAIVRVHMRRVRLASESVCVLHACERARGKLGVLYVTMRNLRVVRRLFAAR